jgi:hypothetical protein
MRQSLGDCTGQDVLSCIFLFFIKLYLGLMLGRLERLFALAEAGKLGPESPLAARTPRAEGGVALAAGQASAQRNHHLISGLWASFVGWASSNPSYGSAAGGSAETDPVNAATTPAGAPALPARGAPAAPAPRAALAAPAAPAAPAASENLAIAGPRQPIHGRPARLRATTGPGTATPRTPPAVAERSRKINTFRAGFRTLKTFRYRNVA